MYELSGQNVCLLAMLYLEDSLDRTDMVVVKDHKQAAALEGIVNSIYRSTLRNAESNEGNQIEQGK